MIDDFSTTDGKVIDVKFVKGSQIIIYLERTTVELNAYADCCSQSWFDILMQSTEEEEEERIIFDEIYLLNHETALRDQLIGCEIDNIVNAFETIVLPFSRIQEHDINHLYNIYTTDKTVQICLRNSSNGYYDGYMSTRFTNRIQWDIMDKEPCGTITFIIGLPGSGKSRYISNNENDYDFVYDDCLSNPNLVYNVFANLYNDNNHICLCDPRFTNVITFDNFINEFSETYFQNCNVNIILFNINKDQCLINNTFRGGSETNYKENNIKRMSMNYNLDNYIISPVKQIEYKRVDVYEA
jgi:hypothetical protein